MKESGFLQRKILNKIEYKHRRRGRQDIIVGILRCAEKGSTKYKMMSAARVSFTQCAEYLKYLAWAGYVSEEAGGIWKTTEKGHLVIDACQICHGYLPQFNESNRARVQAEVKKRVGAANLREKQSIGRRGIKREELAGKRNRREDRETVSAR
jgi:predicted transcriptional regulator